MSYLTLLAAVEICDFWGCTWLETVVAYLQTLVSSMLA
jgi:hypothetical protein